MSKSWLEWTQENIARRCDPVGIASILLANKFSVDEVRAMMGASFPEGAALESTANAATIDADAIRRKREAIVGIRRSLAKLGRGKKLVERRRDLSTAEFLDEYYAANRPVVICGLMGGWKACSAWTPDYLKAVCGEESVEIMAARNESASYEIDDAPHRKQVRFAEFVDMIARGGETNDYYLTARNDFFGRPAARRLLADIEPFSQYLKTDELANGMYLWLGPRGTITPLHHDLMNIFMAQVVGSKLVKLIAPDELDLVYNQSGVYSPIDCGNPDFGRYPNFKDAGVWEVELAPGEVLFLPVGWWHYVKALDTSITVTFNNFLFPNQFEWVHPAPSGKG